MPENIYRYQKVRYRDKTEILLPLVDVRLFVPACSPITTRALVDSGAAVSSFDIEILENFGISRDSLIEQEGIGAGGYFSSLTTQGSK